jgi:hypothetical protein
MFSPMSCYLLTHQLFSIQPGPLQLFLAWLSADNVLNPAPPSLTSILAPLVLPLNSLQIIAFVNRVGDIDSNVDIATFTMEDVESNIVRCPDQEAAVKMIDGGSIVGVREAGVLGGVGVIVFCLDLKSDQKMIDSG